MSAPAIGIDLGTTYSCVGVFQHGKVEIIANDQGNRTMPSCVAFTDNERLVGDVAKAQASRNPENTVFDAKRMIGRKFDDEELKQDLQHWPFKVCDDMGEPKVRVKYRGEKKLIPPVEISAMILTKMKKTAEAYLGETITDAVITVPAYFNNSQRQATRDAGKIAGLNVKRIINEPTAAALAYGLEKKLDREQRVLIFDLGGGTFDVSILTVADNVFEVLSTAGDTHLGGQDFDHQLVKHFSDEFKRKHRKDLRNSPLALRRLKTESEKAKRTLSSSTVANVEIDSLYVGIDFSSKISRARFDDLCADQFRGTLKTVQRALEDAKLERSSIDEVILVGGSTRIPKIRELLQDFFKGKRLNLGINADEAVAYGAAVQAAALSEFQIPGASDHLLVDVVPFSLGVREGSNNFQKLIERGSRVPIRREREFILSSDNQTVAGIAVYEGEHPLVRNNHLLGEFELRGLSPARRGQVKVVVTFDVDADGIMNVSARDKTTGRSEEITVKCKNSLETEELKRIQADAARMEAEAAEHGDRSTVDDFHSYGEEQESDEEGRTGREEKNVGILCESGDEGKNQDGGCEDSEGHTTPGAEFEGDKGPTDREGTSGLKRQHGEKGSDIEREKPEKDCGDSHPKESPAAVQPKQPEQGEKLQDEKSKIHKPKQDEETDKQQRDGKLDKKEQDEESCKPQQYGKPDLLHKRLDRYDDPSVDSMSDDVLFVVQTILDGETKTAITKRLEIYHHCVRLLSRLSTTCSSFVRSRCNGLHMQLREKYGDASGSYNDVTTVPGREPSSLKSRVEAYLARVIQAVVDADAVSESDREKVNNMCKDLMSWMDDHQYAGEYRLLQRIRELQSTCDSVDGLQTPVDDGVKGTQRPEENSVEESEKRAGSDCRMEIDDDSHETKADDDGIRQSHDDMPPLEEVF